VGRVAQFGDPPNTIPLIKIPINPPYIKLPEAYINELGLPAKEYYRTKDVCQCLGISPDLLRYRLRTGKYPESEIVNGKRFFTYEYCRMIIRIDLKKAHGKR